MTYNQVHSFQVSYQVAVIITEIATEKDQACLPQMHNIIQIYVNYSMAQFKLYKCVQVHVCACTLNVCKSGMHALCCMPISRAIETRGVLDMHDTNSTLCVAYSHVNLNTCGTIGAHN